MQIEIEATLKLKLTIPGASGDKDATTEEKKTPKISKKRKAEKELKVDVEDDSPIHTPKKSPSACQHPNCEVEGSFRNSLGVKVCMKHTSTRACEGCGKWYNDKCFNNYCGKRCQKCFDIKQYAQGGFYTQATNPTRSPRPSAIFGAALPFAEKPLFSSKKSPLKLARERRKAEREKPKMKRQESREERSVRKVKELEDELADLFD